VVLQSEMRHEHSRYRWRGLCRLANRQALLDRGDEVIGVDNLNSYYDVNLKLARLSLLEGRSDFSFVKADLAEAQSNAYLPIIDPNA
jgi:nucleoside-diphosphate-sugar epimerase